ncbi:uncharacterized protein LOC132312115 [Cornus florida]|uniref:uncharacterized protein LOC132312115 n=1 Tax=Cornus florida TaxID=4283 RepID=UPI002899B7E8|nr:uncharacterized protein LOC132312115 [Cornus florida]
MANWRSFGDRMLYCHRSILKTWCNSTNPAIFHNSSIGGGGGGGLLLGGGGCFRKAATFLPIRHCCCCCSSSSPPVSPPRSLSSLPLLMVPPGVAVFDHNNSENNESNNNNNNNEEDYFHFVSLSEQSQIRVRKNLSIPWQRDLLMPNKAFCVGSSHGWLAFNHPRNCHPYLYNPLIDSPHIPYIPLPSVETLPTVRGVRSLKSDHSSPSPSLITQFLILLHQNNDIRMDTFEETLSSRRMSGCYVTKLAMSSSPSLPCYSSSSKPELDDNNDCTIMAIYGSNEAIAFCKPGNDRWTVLDGLFKAYGDIIYFSKDQRFYAMNSYDSIEAWDLTDPSCPKNQVFDKISFGLKKPGAKFDGSYNCVLDHYLVESSGNLLLVSRYKAVSVDRTGIVHPRRLEEKVVVNNNDNEEWESHFLHDDAAYWTLGFDVHRLDFDCNKWEPVECLGDRALFVGTNHSFSLSTLDYPELTGNSIYFTDDNFIAFNDTYRGHDNGVFHLKDNNIKPCYPNRLKIFDPHPIWVAPNTI